MLRWQHKRRFFPKTIVVSTENPGPDSYWPAAENSADADGFVCSPGGDVILADGYSKKEEEVVQELREGKIDATFLDGSGQLLAKCVQC